MVIPTTYLQLLLALSLVRGVRRRTRDQTRAHLRRFRPVLLADPETLFRSGGAQARVPGFFFQTGASDLLGLLADRRQLVCLVERLLEVLLPDGEALLTLLLAAGRVDFADGESDGPAQAEVEVLREEDAEEEGPAFDGGWAAVGA